MEDCQDIPDEEIHTEPPDLGVELNEDLIETTETPELVNVILNHLFQYFDAPNLKQFRLVSKSWHEAVSSHFKKKTVCNLRLPNKEPNTNNRGSNELSLSDKINNAAISNPIVFFQDEFQLGFPFGTLNLPYTEDFYMINAIQLKWLTEWGSQLKGLIYNLEESSTHLAKRVVQLLTILSEHCKNLEELEIRGSLGLDVSQLRPLLNQGNLHKLVFRQSVQILGRADQYPQVKNLFNLLSRNIDIEVDVQNEEFSHSITTCIGEVWKNLKSLVWKNSLYGKDLECLKSLTGSSQLQRLELNCFLFPVRTISRDIKQLLSVFSKSLKVLKIDGKIVEKWENWSDLDELSDPEEEERPEYLKYFVLKLPYMNYLRVFEVGDIFHARIHTLDIVMNLPNLKRLKLCNVPYASDVKPFRPFEVFERLISYDMELLKFPHTNLEELYLDGEICKPDFILLLSKCFPNLKILSVMVESDQVFLEVFLRMKNLEELNLQFKSVIDYDWCASAFINYLPNMKDLERLKLQHDGTFFPFLLTEKLIFNGFKATPNLRWLEFVNFSILSTDEEAILKHMNHLMSLKFTNCVIQSPPSNSSYTRWTFPS